MNNKLIKKGLVKSALIFSLVFLSFTSGAGIVPPPNNAPTDIYFGLPIEIEPGHDLIEVAGPGNFGTATPLTLDNPDFFDVSPVFGTGVNFYGTNYTTLAIHPAGQVTLGHKTLNFSPSPLSGYNSGPMFSAVWKDLRAQNAHPRSEGGNSQGTNKIYYHNDTVNRIVTVTWDDVGSTGHFEDGSAFQIRFHMLGNGNFIVENRYESVDASGVIRFGWTNGDLINFDEPYPSADGDFRNLITTNSNIKHPGVFAWMFVNGQVVSSNVESAKVLEKSENGTVIGKLNTEDSDVGDTFTYDLLDDANGRFGLSIINGITYVMVIDGDNRLDFADNTTHDITLRVTDSTSNSFDKTLTINVIEAPVFLTSSNIEIPVDQPLNLTIKTHVGQGSGIPTITATGLPSWMTFVDNSDGTVTLSGYPSFELAYKVTLTVTDSFGNQTARTFNIDVAEPKVREEETITVTVTEEGSDGSSFGWLSLILLGGLAVRRKFS